MNKMRLLFLIIICLILSRIGYSYFNNEKPSSDVIIESKTEEKSLGEIIEITDYTSLENYLTLDEINFLVIGKSGCEYCESYKPVLKEIAKNYEVKILYVDIKNLSNEDLNSLRNSEIIIPAECTDSHIDEHLTYSFGTPLTLFIKNYDSINCIRGYKDYEETKNIVEYVYN